MTFKEGDTVGVGLYEPAGKRKGVVRIMKGKTFFTKNGHFVEIGEEKVWGQQLATVEFYQNFKDTIVFNFGMEPFVFDLYNLSEKKF